MSLIDLACRQLVASLEHLSKAAHDASWAVIEYFNAEHPGAGEPAVRPALQNVLAHSRASLAPSEASNDDAMTVVNGKPVKRKRKPKSERKPRDPNEPKRPLTAFFSFMEHAKPQVTKDMPGATKGEVSNEMTVRWNAM